MRPARTLAAILLFITLAGPAAAQTSLAPDGWAALEAGDAAKAAGIFREALERSPQSAELLYGSAYAARMLGRTDAAMSALKKAIQYEPRMISAHVMLAQLAYETTDLDLAIKTLEKAAALAPKNARIAQQLEQWRGEASVHNKLNTRAGLRFNVMFEGPAEQPIADRISRVLDAAYWRIGKTLNSYPSQTLSVILYSNRQFFDITRAPAWADGGYDGRIRIPVGGALKTPTDFDRVVTHEFVHAVIETAAPRGVPTWVNEGIATYLDSTNRSWARRALREAPVLIPLDRLDGGFGRLDSTLSLVAYAESVIAAETLFEHLGSNVGLFLQALDGGQTVDQALTTLGVSPETFRKAWVRKIRLSQPGGSKLR